jgi:microcompartment protein CcmL/EutN
MKRYPAMAVVEFRDIPQGMYATDKMLKKAPIAFVRCGTISRGRYLTVLGGTTGSIDEAFREGLFWGGDSVLDSALLADIHPQVHDAILGTRHLTCTGAMAIVETPTVASNVRAAELALKGTTIELVELRLADLELSGKGLSVYQGELHDLEAAMDIISSRLGSRMDYRVLPMPHEAMNLRMASPSPFGAANLMELDGEPT